MDGCGCCTSKCAGTKLLVVGLVLVVNQLYSGFKYDPWVVVGALLVIKGIAKMVMPTCMCHAQEAVVVKKRR